MTVYHVAPVAGLVLSCLAGGFAAREQKDPNFAAGCVVFGLALGQATVISAAYAALFTLGRW
jgi:hypothetical protein